MKLTNKDEIMKQVNTYKILKAMVEMAPKSDIRYYLNGVHIYKTDRTVTIEATCGHSLIRVVVNNPLNSEFNIENDTNIIICRHSLLNIIKLFNVKIPPVININNGSVFLNNYEVDTIDGRFPDISRQINARSEKDLSHVGQGVNLKLMTKCTKSMSMLVESTLLTNHELNGFKLISETTVGNIIVLIMPCRL